MSAYSLTPNPAVFLAAVAARTRRVRLAVLGFPVPILNPLRVAEEAAMLDIQSAGRVMLGLVRGVPQNYAAYNFEPDESRNRFEEAVSLMKRAWTANEPFAWKSRFYDFPNVSIWPKPYQQPFPEIIFSGNSPQSAEIGALHQAAIAAIHIYSRDTLELVERSFAAYKAAATRMGWTPSARHFMLGLPTCIARTDAEACAAMRPALDYQFRVLSGTYNEEKRAIAAAKPGYGFTPVEESPPDLDERLERRMVLCGSPQTVIRQIADLRELLGVGLVSMQMSVGNISDQTVETGMRLFRDHIRPRFLELGHV